MGPPQAVGTGRDVLRKLVNGSRDQRRGDFVKFGGCGSAVICGIVEVGFWDLDFK